MMSSTTPRVHTPRSTSSTPTRPSHSSTTSWSSTRSTTSRYVQPSTASPLATVHSFLNVLEGRTVFGRVRSIRSSKKGYVDMQCSNIKAKLNAGAILVFSGVGVFYNIKVNLTFSCSGSYALSKKEPTNQKVSSVGQN